MGTYYIAEFHHLLLQMQEFKTQKVFGQDIVTKRALQSGVHLATLVARTGLKEEEYTNYSHCELRWEILIRIKLSTKHNLQLLMLPSDKIR